MTKPARSRVIEDFLAGVQFGKIAATDDREGSNAGAILAQLVAALQAILEGQDPEAAFAIERQTGPAQRPESWNLALLIHLARERGDSWAAIECAANDLLVRSGRPAMKERGLKKIHEKHGVEAARLVSSVRALQRGAAVAAFEQINPAAAQLMLVVMNIEKFLADPNSVGVERE